MKKKYKIALCVIGVLIYLDLVLLASNIMLRIAVKEYCSKIPFNQFLQNNYCLDLYGMEEKE